MRILAPAKGDSSVFDGLRIKKISLLELKNVKGFLGILSSSRKYSDLHTPEDRCGSRFFLHPRDARGLLKPRNSFELRARPLKPESPRRRGDLHAIVRMGKLGRTLQKNACLVGSTAYSPYLPRLGAPSEPDERCEARDIRS